jgi:hypothetical protein
VETRVALEVAASLTLPRIDPSLITLRQQLQEMSQTYREQSALSEKYEASSKFWKTFTPVGLLVAR